jgi:hypothetical protein
MSLDIVHALTRAAPSQQQLLHDFHEDEGQHIQWINGNVTVQGVGTLVLKDPVTLE